MSRAGLSGQEQGREKAEELERLLLDADSTEGIPVV
jgi:hypothetical protein